MIRGMFDGFADQLMTLTDDSDTATPLGVHMASLPGPGNSLYYSNPPAVLDRVQRDLIQHTHTHLSSIELVWCADEPVGNHK